MSATDRISSTDTIITVSLMVFLVLVFLLGGFGSFALMMHYGTVVGLILSLLAGAVFLTGFHYWLKQPSGKRAAKAFRSFVYPER